ncbi:hypothetical protein HS088_TW15G00659 [Tripterygium wilfordii]|uniref:Prolamin-like domain-containing protein n=1 Tax=Tripterygium wilfordii TaxID=458696 RepID=A0A7J7CM99_TRIWF|nr:hypothetical protein HS088_TW15G00659 [Tripterygium wilfordii]
MARLMVTSVVAMAICTIMVSQIVVAEPAAAAAATTGSDMNSMQCWAALLEIKGCVESITKVFQGSGIVEVERACCEALLAIVENCWPKMFTFHPIVPPKLMAFCSAFAAAPAPI